MTVDASGSIRGLEVRPHLPIGYSGCSHASASTTVAPPPGGLKEDAILVSSPVESVAIPVLPGGKGVPFMGQQEVTDADVLAAGSESLDAAGRAALQEQLKRQGKGADKQPEPSFFQKYWHFILLGYALLLLNRGGGGQEGGSGGGRPAASGR